MTQSQKDLLLKDLCARLPYGVKIALKNSEAYHHKNVAKKDDITIDKLKDFNGSYFSIYHDNPLDWDWYVSDIDVEDIKPYLFPLSSMSEEQKEEYYSLADDVTIKPIPGRLGMKIHCIKLGISDNPHEEVWDYVDLDAIDWLNKNHFDYRCLIEKGLAIDATNLNIY